MQTILEKGFKTLCKFANGCKIQIYNLLMKELQYIGLINWFYSKMFFL